MTRPVMHIGRRVVGQGKPTYIIAEIGINHNGDMTMARRLVDAAAEAQADAVKLQKRHLPSLFPEEMLRYPERFEQSFQYTIPLYQRVELEMENLAELKERAERQGLDFLCTPFDIVSADQLHELDLSAYKVSSADLTNHTLIEHVTAFARPMLLSTGMSLWEEVELAVALLRRLRAEFALLHCRSVYPVWPRDVNLRMIDRLRQFGVPVGYSGHEVGIIIPLVAASMGAHIIEKHLTLDHALPGPDHRASLVPYDFKRLVRDIRIADEALGHKERAMLRGEVLNRELLGKSLVASRDMYQGESLTRDKVSVRGPAKGLPPYRLDDLLGRTAQRKIRVGEYLREDDFAPGGCDVPGIRTMRGQWGLIVRFTDYEVMLAHGPKVLEFHLAERDLDVDFHPPHPLPCHLVVHVPEYMGEQLMDLCSSNEAQRQASVRQTLRAMCLTRSLATSFIGRPKLIVHPGAMSLREKLDPARLRLNLERSLEELRAMSECRGLELLLENLAPYPWYFGGQWKCNFFMDCEEIAAFCADHGLGLCYDLSHNALYCNAKEKDLADQISAVLPHASHLHLADAYGLDGEGVPFGEGDMPEIWRGHQHGGEGFLAALEYLSRQDVFGEAP